MGLAGLAAVYSLAVQVNVVREAHVGGYPEERMEDMMVMKLR